jgi:hypothetical protein
MKLENMNSLSSLEDNEGECSIYISMVRTFFSIHLHLLVFPLGEMTNQMLAIKSFHHQQKRYFQRHSLPYLTPEIQPC